MRGYINSIVCIVLTSIPVIAQNDWQFIDETELRLPDITTLADRMDVGDVDGDDDLDIVVACSEVPWPFTPGYEQIFINDGDGFFLQQNSDRLPLINDFTAVVLLLDIDSDRDLDLLVGNSIQDSSYMAVNNGSGVFARDNGRMPHIIGTLQGADYGDVDNDGDLDIYASINHHDDILLINDGFGYFDIGSEMIPSISMGAVDVRMADFDNDLDLDILLVIYGESPKILINDGNGDFVDDTENRLNLDFGLFGNVDDVDHDSDIDILIIPATNCAVLINDGAGYFADESEIRFPDLDGADPGNAIVYADADNDGDKDIGFAYSGNSRDYILINDGNGFFEDQTDQRMPQVYASTLHAIFADLDSDEDVDYFRVGDADARNSIFVNTINNPDSISPVFMNIEIYDNIVIEPGPYPLRCFVNDGVSLINRQVLVKLFYSLDAVDYIPIEMSHSGGFMFREEISEVDSGITVYYYYYSEDHLGNFTTYPLEAPDNVFSFIYLPDYTSIDGSGVNSRSQLTLTAYPNPFNSLTTITLNGTEGGKIEIYNIKGQRIRTIIIPAKEGKIIWDARDALGNKVSSGIYFARARAPHKSNRIKLLYLK